MTTAVVDRPGAVGGRVTQARVLLSEWTKLRSVRSTRWSLLATVVLTIGTSSTWRACRSRSSRSACS